jgi:hypothetical protein
MKELKIFITNKPGLFGLGAGLGSAIARLVDGNGVGNIIGLGIVVWIIVAIAGNMLVKAVKK